MTAPNGSAVLTSRCALISSRMHTGWGQPFVLLINSPAAAAALCSPLSLLKQLRALTLLSKSHTRIFYPNTVDLFFLFRNLSAWKLVVLWSYVIMTMLFSQSSEWPVRLSSTRTKIDLLLNIWSGFSCNCLTFSSACNYFKLNNSMSARLWPQT